MPNNDAVMSRLLINLELLVILAMRLEPSMSFNKSVKSLMRILANLLAIGELFFTKEIPISAICRFERDAIIDSVSNHSHALPPFLKKTDQDAFL